MCAFLCVSISLPSEVHPWKFKHLELERIFFFYFGVYCQMCRGWENLSRVFPTGKMYLHTLYIFTHAGHTNFIFNPSFPLTSSSRLLCSFCSSMRFCLSANSKRLCSSFCCCSSCCRRCASERSLFASCRRRKSRLRVDSPGMLMMELECASEKKNSASVS